MSTTTLDRTLTFAPTRRSKIDALLYACKRNPSPVLYAKYCAARREPMPFKNPEILDLAYGINADLAEVAA